MTSLQYVGDSHTTVLLPGETVKRKVVNGEIISTDDVGLVKTLAYRGFKVVDDAVTVELEDDGKDAVTVEVTAKKKSK